jgi:hypothetical protein
MIITWIENIATVLGCITAAVAVITLISKNARDIFKKAVSKYSHADESSEDIKEIKEMLIKHIQEDSEFREETRQSNAIALEFTKTSCRNLIKNIFYKYKETEVLPLYEKKTLMSIEELYIDKLHCNSFAKYLLDEMRDWEVDYDSTHADEVEEEN